MHWLMHVLGIDSSGSNWNRFWSGFGSDLGEAAIVAGLAAAWRRHTCHIHRCWRFARHPVAGTPYVCCAKHHPDVPHRIKHVDVIEHPERARTR